MATTFKRKCLHDVKFDGLILKKNTEYITSKEEEGAVVVFTGVWAKVPVSWFEGAVLFTGKDMEF